MKKYFLFLFFIIPFFAFTQLNEQEKQLIDNYAVNLCDCVNDLINTLDPVMIDYIKVLAGKGEIEAQEFLTDYLSSANEEETNLLLTSANKMESEEFISKIENCDSENSLSEIMVLEINNEKGISYDYFLQSMSDFNICNLTKMFYYLGSKTE